MRNAQISPRITELHQQNPEITAVEIGKILGKSPDYIRRVMVDMGLRSQGHKIDYLPVKSLDLKAVIPERCTKCGGMIRHDPGPKYLEAPDEFSCIACGSRYYTAVSH